MTPRRDATAEPDGAPATDGELAADDARRLLRLMLLVRRFEERTEEQYTRARIGGYCHLAIGEEAANVGAIDCLVEGDYLFASYRDHAAALAVGSDPSAVMAELFGKQTGVAGGFGGSMHLLDVERNFLGGWGIVGGHLPIAVGAALALDYTDAPNAVLCQFGDGATNTGAFHEALNLATIWNLPIVFQAVNNLYGMGTSVEGASGEPEIWKRACAYRMHGERVDGNDVVAVREASCRLLERARSERKPALLETMTYRYRGHSVADAGKVYRSKDEVASWRERDPIEHFARVLEERGVISEDDVTAMRKEVSAEVAQAIRDAASAPAPDVEALADNVYSDEDTAEQFARMRVAGPFGEREGTTSWRT
jgi:pyruvate dehydrogenase E1 component alpha subunit